MFNLTFIGRVGGQAGSGITKKGEVYAFFSLAVNFGAYESRETMWISVKTYGSLAEKAVKGIRTGGRVCVVARDAKIKTWQRADGSTGAALEVTAAALDVIDRLEEQDAANVEF